MLFLCQPFYMCFASWRSFDMNLFEAYQFEQCLKLFVYLSMCVWVCVTFCTKWRVPAHFCTTRYTNTHKSTERNKSEMREPSHLNDQFWIKFLGFLRFKFIFFFFLCSTTDGTDDTDCCYYCCRCCDEHPFIYSITKKNNENDELRNWNSISFSIWLISSIE